MLIGLCARRVRYKSLWWAPVGAAYSDVDELASAETLGEIGGGIVRNNGVGQSADEKFATPKGGEPM